jgi:AraC family transcriptional regulator, transcriptional activator of pobA
MQRTLSQIPVYRLDEEKNLRLRGFRLYQFDGDTPQHAELLIPHRKDHYLFVFARHAPIRQWIDMHPIDINDNTAIFSTPDNVIVKEEMQPMWSTGIAFTPDFIGINQNEALARLPIILDPLPGHVLSLSEKDISFLEAVIESISIEYDRPGEWQTRILSAHLTVLMTYVSRLFSRQYSNQEIVSDKQLLTRFSAKVNECFRELHEVSDYASLLNVSAGHLSDAVKEQSGRPAIKHIHARRIMEARRLLFHTDQSVKEIAFELGFADASYFNRFFKRETGSTPAEYRASIQKMYH